MASLQELLAQLEQEYATTSEVAEILSKATGAEVDRAAVTRLVKSEKVESMTIGASPDKNGRVTGGKHYVSRSSVKELIKSGWKPGERVGGDREHVCYNVWLKREDVEREQAAIRKALGRDVRMQQRKYYHKKKEAEASA